MKKLFNLYSIVCVLLVLFVGIVLLRPDTAKGLSDAIPAPAVEGSSQWKVLQLAVFMFIVIPSFNGALQLIVAIIKSGSLTLMMVLLAIAVIAICMALSTVATNALK